MNLYTINVKNNINSVAPFLSFVLLFTLFVLWFLRLFTANKVHRLYENLVH